MKARQPSSRVALAAIGLVLTVGATPVLAAPSALSEEAKPLADLPERPAPPLELGEPFLGTGTLSQGFELPTGAVWQPSLLLFGTFRTAVQTFDRGGDGDTRTTEWANRLDAFLNLYLTASERVVVGFRPLDKNGRFTGYVFESPDPELDGEFQDEFDADLESLFFEGDFGEMFPNLSEDDFLPTDIGISVGRQPLFFQEGILVNDTIDAVGFTRNTLLPAGTSNFRATALFGWNNIDRRTRRPGAMMPTNTDDGDALLFGLLTSTDFPWATMDIDLVFVTSSEEDLQADLGNGILEPFQTGGDLLTGGASFVRRFGAWNWSLRGLGSIALGDETTTATDGLLLFSELSWTPTSTIDLLYLSTFWGIEEFSSAARGAATGGPLGRAGISFAAVGLGSYGAPLSNDAKDVVGGALGYQWFFDATRKQIIAEIGGRLGTDDDVGDQVAATLRYQMAIWTHFVVVADGFVGYRERDSSDDTLLGGRLELLTKF